MQLLMFYQGYKEIMMGLFESLDEGREFIELIPGYNKYEDEEGFIEETIDPRILPNYIELDFHGHLIPITRFSFIEDSLIQVHWIKLPDLSQKGTGLVDGSTKVDAYMVENKDLEAYIEKREAKFLHVKELFKSKGYVVERSFAGSEDGEAILYRKENVEAWHFLTHMDACFVENDITDEEFIEVIQ